MNLPADVQRWIDDHTGAPASSRLLRCALVGSRGDLEELRSLVELMAIDYRDVIMSGEYEVSSGRTVHVRDLNQPL